MVLPSVIWLYKVQDEGAKKDGYWLHIFDVWSMLYLGGMEASKFFKLAAWD